MLRKTGLFSVLAAVALAAPLHAEEHYVMLLDTGYFPDLVHPSVGDTVRFYNQGELPMSATASDGSWSTGLLLPGQDYTLEVVDGMKATYNNLLPDALDLGGLLGTTGEVVEAILSTPFMRSETRRPWTSVPMASP